MAAKKTTTTKKTARKATTKKSAPQKATTKVSFRQTCNGLVFAGISPEHAGAVLCGPVECRT
jgi:hypothetical protein